jgi:hypothetical protein
VKHAAGSSSESRGKEALTGDMDIARAKIDVEVMGFKLLLLVPLMSFVLYRSGTPVSNG